MLQRPSNFTLDPSHPLSKGLRFHWLGRYSFGPRLVAGWTTRTFGNTTTSMDASNQGYANNRVSLTFDGSAEYISFDAANLNIPIIPTSGDYTFACWMKVTSGLTSDSTLIAQQTVGDNNSRLVVYANRAASGNKVRWFQGVEVGVATTDIRGTWAHVAGTRSGNNFTLYINGVAEDTGSTTNTTGQSFVNIGNRTDATALMSGEIADLCSWDGVKTQAEIAVLASADPLYDNWIAPIRRVYAVKAPAAAGNQPLYTINLLKQMSG